VNLGRRIAVLALCLLASVPNPAYAAGTMMLRFRVDGPLDFTKVRYVVLLNTTGNGIEPYANPITGPLNYSFAWIVGGDGTFPSVRLVQYYLAPGPGTGLQTRQIVVPPQQVQLNITSRSAPGEFTLTFDRALLSVPSPTGQRSSPIWSINFVTTDPEGNPIDANGTTGITDTSFMTYARVDTRQNVDLRYFKPAGATAVSNPSAAINQNEVINTP